MAVFPASTRYTRPGSYLGQVFRPRPTAPTGVTFRPCYVGKGHRLAKTRNASVRRSWIEVKQLSFTSVSPFIATLTYAAKNDRQPPVSLYDHDGNEVSTRKWQFWESVTGSGTYDQILFNAADYDKTKTYYLDYQSSDRTYKDELPFDDPRMITTVGLFPDQDLYNESLDPADEDDEGDFVVPGTLDDFDADSGNTYPDPAVSSITESKTGSGSVSFGSSNDPTSEYTKYYQLEVTAIGAGPPKEVTFKLTTWLHSSGNATGAEVPLTSAVADKTFTVDEAGTGIVLDTNRQLIDGIYLDFTFGATNFVVSDTFSWFSYGPGKFEEHSAYDASNTQFPSASDPAAAGNMDYTAVPPTAAANTSTATWAQGTSSEFTGEYIRDYGLEVTAVGGSPATGTLTFTLAQLSDNEHFTLSNGIESVTFEFDVSGSATPVSGRVMIDISAAGSDDAVATASAPVIANASNWPSGVALGAVAALNVVTCTNASDGNAGNVTITAYESDGTTVSTGIAHTGMSGGQLTATVAWGGYDELPYTTGSMALDDTSSTSYTNVSLELGLTLTVTWPAINATSFVIGDTWTFKARPGKIYYNAKDDRVYTLTNTAVSGLTVTGTYAATTIEGSFGTFTVTIAATGAGGSITLEDNVVFMCRNAGNTLNTPTGIDAPTRHAVSDVTTFDATCDDLIDWAIDRRVTETVASTAIIYDAIGAVTGTPGTYYLVLDDTPTSIIHVQNASTSADLTYTWVSSSPYISFASDPGVSVEVKYQYRGDEPTPAQVYYVSGTRLRATTEFDTPMLWRTIDSAKDGLSPSSITNDVLIASEISDEAGILPEWYTIQVSDLDDDGIYQVSDYKRAIQATEDRAAISDVVVLNQFNALGTAIQSVENANDMFNFPSKVRMLWVGVPANTPLGDEDTSGSIIYTAKRTLQVSGASPSHGCHVLIANTYATRDVVLDDLSTKSITVDGSFIAVAAVAKQDGFTDVGDTLLYKTLGGIFTSMETFSDAEMLAIGGASITYLDETGDGIFRFEEDVTVDKAAIDYQQIQAMKQKHYVIRNTTEQMGSKLTGFVPPDPFAAIALIQSFLAEIMGNYVSAGVIAPYGAEQSPPIRRKINPTQDIKVYQDETIKTDYYYVYFFNLRYPIKRTTGLFGVDSDEIIKGIARTV
jgi:hypothetical protein